MTDTLQKLSSTTKISFGIGQMSEGIKTACFAMLLLLYYNQVLGLPGALCGIALAIAVLSDAVTDPIIGNLSDVWRSRLGRRHPFLYASILPMGVCFFLLFNPPVSGETPLFLWLLTFTILSRAAMTLFTIPHSTLGAELSNDFHERTALAAWKQFFGAFGYMTVFVLGFMVYFLPSDNYPNGQLNPAAYPPLTTWLALLMSASIFISALGTHSSIPSLPKPTDEQRFSIKRVFIDSLSTMRNDSFRPLLIGFATLLAAGSAAAALMLYMMTFFWQLDSSGILAVLILSPIGGFIAYASSKRFFNTFDKRNGIVIGAMIWCLAHALLVPIFLSGWLPERGQSGLLVAICVSHVLTAFGMGQVYVGLSTMIADIVDEHELHTHQRVEGTFYGVFAFLNKAAIALGSLTSGFFLDFIGWPSVGKVRTAADVPTETILNLGLIWGPVVGLLALPGIFLMSRYKLTRVRHNEIVQILKERRQSKVQAGMVSKPQP